MTSDPESELIAQQLKHTIDLLRFEIDNLKTAHDHAKEISDHRFNELEECTSDHEGRIHTLQDDVTQIMDMKYETISIYLRHLSSANFVTKILHGYILSKYGPQLVPAADIHGAVGNVNN